MGHERAERMYGKGLEALGAPGMASTPWPPVSGLKTRKDYDEDLVNHAVASGQTPEPVDPRYLFARQPHLRPEVVRHYMGSNEVYADQHQAGNQVPVVYERHPQPGSPSWQQPRRLILSGHHRAAAALLRGEQFHAILVKGGFGPER